MDYLQKFFKCQPEPDQHLTISDISESDINDEPGCYLAYSFNDKSKKMSHVLGFDSTNIKDHIIKLRKASPYKQVMIFYDAPEAVKKTGGKLFRHFSRF